MAISPSNNDYLYIATLERFTSCLSKVWQSKDGGTTWTNTDYSDDDSFQPLGCLGWLTLSLAVNPSNPSQIFLGGAEFWAWEEDAGWNRLEGTPLNPVSPYINNILFDTSNSNALYLTSASGISKSSNAQESSPDFASINKNYRATQFYGMAASIDGSVMGGAQSNGVILVNPDKNADTRLEGEAILDGTGGFCAISKLKPTAIFAARQAGAIKRAANKNVPLSSFFDENTDCCNPDERLDGNPLFITPFVLWEDIIGNIISGEENSMFVTGNCEGEVWMTEGALDFSTTPTWRKIGQFESNFTCVSAIAVSSNGTDVYVGTTSGEILHITDLDKENPTLIETSATENFQYISSINVLQNPNHIIVGLGNYGHASNIMESINAASQNPSFTSLQSNLPLMPVYSVARNPLEPNTLLVGTELGIWQYDFAAQTWTEENGIMGRVPVHSLQFEQMREISCNVLYAATHGRGMYRTTDFTFGSCDTEIAVGIASLEDQITSLQLFPNPLQSHSNLEIVLNETTDLTLRIFDLQGQMVRQQSLGEMTARKHSIRIEKRDLRTGMYLVMLQSGKRQMSRKLMVD